MKKLILSVVLSSAGLWAAPTVVCASAPVCSRRDVHTAKDVMDYKFSECGVPYAFPDHKIVWGYNPTYNNYREWPFQFARFRFLPPLARYYAQTGDEKAAQTYVAIVESFIDEVKPPVKDTGPGAAGNAEAWRTLDTGLRATSIISSYPLVAKSAAVTEGFKAKFFASLADHVRRLKPCKTSNNWRIMEVRGLLDIVLMFPEKYDADGALRAQCEAELRAMLKAQLYPDGFQFELAPGYHSILDGDYTALARRYRELGATPPEFLERDIEPAFDMYPHLMRPNRTMPPVNDSGAMDVVERMQRAAKLFPNRRDFLWFATDGKEGERPNWLSYAFPYAGACVFRDSFARDAVWGYLDAGPFGRAHQHEDKLNFLLFAYGREMIREGGCYAYDTSEMRKYVLSTRSHNTIRIDGQDQNTRRGYKWQVDDINRKADFLFETTPGRDFAEAKFTAGYGKGKECSTAVSHTRRVEFIKEGGAPYFRIIDTLEATDDGEHAYEQLWHVEKCAFTLAADGFTADFGGGVKLVASFKSEGGTLVDKAGQKEPEWQGWAPLHPPGPNAFRPIPTPTLLGRFTKRTQIVTELRPSRGVRR